MCLMCVEIFKGRMTISEGRTALKELMSTTENRKDLEHYRELARANDEDFMEKVKEQNDSQEES